MKRVNKRCPHCGRRFLPGKYNPTRQRYCIAPDCRKASKRASDKKYRRKMSKSLEFRQKESQRAQVWQSRNPSCKKNRKKSAKKFSETEVLRDFAPIQKKQSDIGALRDFVIRQHIILKGLVSYTTGEVLRDDVSLFFNRLYDRGKEVSGIGSGTDISTRIINMKVRNETQSINRAPPQAQHT